jgi:ethanolamine utilization protein EutQ (cupin superfamily)
VVTSTDIKPAFDSRNAAPFGPSVIEKRTATTSLSELGTSFMEFTETGATEPWTLHYEETIFVLEGRLRLTLLAADGETVVDAGVGELLALPAGSTVLYEAQAGTRLLLSITPVNWRDRVSATSSDR